MAKTAAFEQYSDAYDEWFRKHEDTYEAELELIRGLLPLPGTRGLEVGAGSGKFAGPLGISIGVEPSVRMAEKAAGSGIRVVRGVAENLPFAGAAFDFVLMVTTICFVDDISKSFAEARRVLKTDGCLIVGFIDRESELGRQYETNREQSRFYREAAFFSAEEVVEHIKNSGFRVNRVRQTLFSGSQENRVREGFGQGAFVAVSGVTQSRHMLFPTQN